MKRLKYLILLLFPPSLLFAQQTIEGIVTDAATNETLIGVTILVKGSTSGTITDIEGHYTLSSGQLNASSVLVFSYVGYTSIEQPIGDSTRIDVKLEPSVTTLDELVIIGYGSLKKRDVLGSVSKVSGNDLIKIPVAGLDQALQGRAAGVQVSQNTGAPGEGVSVRIRGTGSINSGNDPLYIVNGIPTVDALNILSPGDIESISLLKDASAAAIYGSRANNGVVLITTKKGVKGKSQITYHGQTGIQQVGNLVDMVNTSDYVKIYNEAATNDNANSIFTRELISEADAGNFANINYVDELFRKAVIQSHELSFSGGTGATSYIVSTSYYDQDGIITGSSYKRGTVRVEVNSEVKKWLTVGANMHVGFSKRDIVGSSGDGAGGNGGSIIRYAFFRNPAIPIRFDNGTYVDRPSEYFGDSKYDSFLGDGYNPIGMADYADNTEKDDSYLGKAYFTAKITDDLSFTTNFGIDYRNSAGRRFDRTWGTDSRISNPNSLSVTESRMANWTVNNLLNYEHTFADKHSLSAMAGFEAIKNSSNYSNSSDSDFPIEEEELIYIGNGLKGEITSQGETASSLVSIFGRINYNFNGKYFISATIRRDGSSRFTAGNRWGTFGAVSAGWSLDQEAFLRDLDWLQKLKLRAGYGAIGNQNIGLYANVDRISSNNNYAFGGISNDGYAQTALGNKNLKWETSYQYDVGVDAELWKGAFSVSLDYYYKVTEDMLVEASNPPSVGYASAAWINSGSVLNTGIEIEVTYRKQKTDWGYSIGGNLATIHNEVLKLEAPLLGGLVETGVYATRTEVGQPIGSFYLLEMDGIFQNETDILLSAVQGSDILPGDVKFKDHEVNGTIDNADRVYLGSAIPKLSGGINFSVNYKSFDWSVFFQGTYGNKIYSQLAQDIEGFYRGFTVTQRYFNEHWTGEGSSNSQPRASWNAKSNNARPSSRFLEDGSYLRMKNIQLGYTLPVAVLNKIHMEKARIYISGSNLLTFTKYSGLDPEMTVSDNSSDEGDRSNGIDWGTYPSAISYMIGLDITF